MSFPRARREKRQDEIVTNHVLGKGAVVDLAVHRNRLATSRKRMIGKTRDLIAMVPQCTAKHYNEDVNKSNSFGSASTLTVAGKQYRFYSLQSLEQRRVGTISRIAYSIRI